MSGRQFTFDGRGVDFTSGQSLAAALTQANLRELRQTPTDQKRGMFCGMGVCQDCLVTIDGVPNQRACMTPAATGMAVKAQVAFPVLEDTPLAPAATPARILEPDITIIGGGAGGLSAAIAARRAGASVVVLDERKVGGGQFYKQSASHPPLDAQQSDGAALLAEAKASGAELIDAVEVWGAFDGPLLLAERAGAALIVRPGAVIVATGAYERPVTVPGWTLPGVMTTGAAQTLWRSYRTLPGKRVAICGSGPLNVQVALELSRGGAEVVMVAEAAPPAWHMPATAAKALFADPRLILKGVSMLRELRGAGVALQYQTRLQSVAPDADGLLARFISASGSATEVQVDALCMNAGFEPQNEVLRLLGADMTYDPAVGHFRCTRDAMMRTSVPGIFAVGDCAGLGGAPAARTEGNIAGRAAAALTGWGDGYDQFADQRRLTRHRRFQANLWKLFDIVPPALGLAPADTILCRCEEITLGEAREGLQAQPGHLGTLKRATRLGMGRCQGRYCGPNAARLVAQATGKPIRDLSYFAPRIPIKPVSIAAILAVQEALGDED